MPRVHCALPNASDFINGIPFVSAADGGVISGPLDPAVAAQFTGIRGYTLIEDEPTPPARKRKAHDEEAL